VAHRATLKLPIPLTISLFEGNLITGPGKHLSFWYLSPFRSWVYAGQDEQDEPGANFLVGADLLAEPSRRLSLYASVMIDDLQTVGPSTNDEPASYGFTVAARAGLSSTASVTAFYTQISNLAYRSSTGNPADNVARRGVGLARNFSDYDQTTLRVAFSPIAGAVLEPEVTLLRQGEGDFRLPFPTPADNVSTPTIFDGVVERTLRAALRASLYVQPGVSIDGNAGVHLVQNAGHVTGVSDTRFVGQAAARFHFGGAFNW
jgi:hypothetical protein